MGVGVTIARKVLEHMPGSPVAMLREMDPEVRGAITSYAALAADLLEGADEVGPEVSEDVLANARILEIARGVPALLLVAVCVEVPSYRDRLDLVARLIVAARVLHGDSLVGALLEVLQSRVLVGHVLGTYALLMARTIDPDVREGIGEFPALLDELVK